MRAIAVLVLAGCASSQPHVVEPAPVAEVGQIAPPDADANAEAVELRRRHVGGERYRVKTQFALVECPYHADMTYEVLAEARLEPRGGDFVAHGRFLSSTLTHGDAVDPLGARTDVAGAQLLFVLDQRNRVRSRDMTPSTFEHAMAAQEVMEGVEHVRISYPDRPVRTGESWTSGTVRWDTRPLGWVAVVMEPTFTLERVEQRAGHRWARVRWSGELAVEPFEILGMRIAARAPVAGVSEVSLDDGYTGQHAIELDVTLTTASGAGGGETIARVRVVQQVERL